MSGKVIKRHTYFQVKKEEDIDTILQQYEVLRNTAVKDDKPYILSNSADRILNKDQRAHGYTVAVQTVFASREDHDFYDSQCPAHLALKKVATPLRDDVATFVVETNATKM